MGIYDWLRGKKSYQSVHNSGQGWNSIFVAEPYSGAWQENKEITREDMTAFYAVFACVSLISKDIGKMPVLLKKKQQGVLVDALTPKELQRVLQKPNNYQNWQQFNEQWTQSLLLRGNTYVFKMRDVFGELYRLVVLNPDLVTVLVDDQANVFYQLTNDRLTQADNVIVPASEIIHDRINAIYHPLVGLTPIMACSLASEQGISILRNSKNFFANGSKPGGVIEVPGPLDATKAQEVKTKWDANYSGANVGKTGLLSDGAKYVNISMSAIDSQLIEQLGMSARIVCTAFNVPPFKIGVTDVQGATKVSDLNEIYYSDCLQSYIEARENLLDEGLDLPSYGVEAFLDLDVLIRMDSSSKIAYFKDGISAGIFAPNEARQKLGYLPVKGGESPYLQQQNYNLEALAKRDAKEDPFGKSESTTQSDNPLKSLYKGVFKDDVQYQKGQFITKNGALWHVENDHFGEFDHKNFKLCAKEWTE
ncbi:HK97 family phage portal protein [Acinetobacter ursingii NIPH 706]|uniref:phage portal protein n=1 Tax=Acinetobacter ursingii TaxID=108980 RepID=UPI0002D0BC8A|nr:phage portal protein [Acinetobacter ursingii]ENX48632.1 HK97 family phage portal protein [Acinetobacter ursingii NIPH 706]